MKIFYLSHKKKIIFSVLLIFFVIQILNFTGFCYSEKRYLGERELIERALLGSSAKKMSDEQKISALKEKGFEYPECCRISGQWDHTKGGTPFINNIFGHFLHKLIAYSKLDKPSESEWPFYEAYIPLTSCGYPSWDRTGISIKKSSYDVNISINKKYWSEK